MADENKKLAHKNIYAALSGFQEDLKPIDKDGKVKFKAGNSEVEFSYATLGNTMKSIAPLLGKHGLSVHWVMHEDGIECIAMHETSERIQNPVVNTSKSEEDGSIITKNGVEVLYSNMVSSGKVPVEKKTDMKEVGAQITYARRYTLGLVLGIVTDDDKDAALLDQSNQNTKQFAFDQVKKNILGAKDVEALNKQKLFLEKELKTARAFETGDGKKVPSLGLSVKQYEELLELARTQSGEEEVIEDGSKDDEPVSDKE